MIVDQLKTRTKRIFLVDNKRFRKTFSRFGRSLRRLIAMGPKPHVIAVVLCDYISQGQGGKFNLIGTLNIIGAVNFPMELPSLGLFFMANSMPPNGILSFRLVHEGDGVTSIQLPSLTITKASEDHNEIFQMGGQLHRLQIPIDGNYRLLTLWNGDEIHSQIVQVKKIGGAT